MAAKSAANFCCQVKSWGQTLITEFLLFLEQRHVSASVTSGSIRLFVNSPRLNDATGRMYMDNADVITLQHMI